MSHEHPSGLSYTINTNLDPTISLDGLRLMTPAEDNIQADIAQASLPRSTQPQDTIQRLNFIVSSFQNEECSKVQALMELLNIINQQSNLSELQKGQTFDKYHSQINSIESTLKGTGNPVVFSNTPSSPEVTSRTVVSVPSQSRVKAQKRPPGLIKYKAPPKNWQEGNHHWYYGWVLMDDFKREYLIKNRIRVPSCDAHIMHSVVCDLKHRSGFPVALVGVQPDDVTAAEGKVLEEGTTDFDGIALSCTRSKKLFYRRPNTVQMDKLIEIFGEEPRWLRDSATKKEFEEQRYMDN